MPRAVLFDFNGVLVDDEPIHRRLLMQTLAEEGVTVEADWARVTFLGTEDRGCLRAAFACADRALDPVLEARMLARKAARYRAEIAARGYPFVAGAKAAVAGLADAGLVIGVVSGALRGEVEEALGALGVRRKVAIVVTAEDVTRGKPDPEGYLLALERLQRAAGGADRLIHPHEVVAIEDSPTGLAAATAAGLRTLALVAAPLAGVPSPAEAVIGSLDELSAERLFAAFGLAADDQATGIRPAKPSS